MLSAGATVPSFSRRPVFGLDVVVPPPQRPIVLCFVRSLSNPLTREALAILQQHWPRFDLEGVQVVAVTDSEPVVAQDFVPRYHVLFPVICDPEHALFQAFQVGGDQALAGTVRALAGGGVRNAFRALRHGHGPLERKQLKLPAEFVVAPDGRLLYSHYGRSMTDVPDVDALIAACS